MPRKPNRILVVDGSEVARTIIVRILNEEMPDTEIITTGTLTDAWSIAPGDEFSATYENSPLPKITARFSS